MSAVPASTDHNGDEATVDSASGQGILSIQVHGVGAFEVEAVVKTLQGNIEPVLSDETVIMDVDIVGVGLVVSLEVKS